MRQGQKNNRSRGRGRRPQNPVNRIFESNGPDVKIRGNASHIAEKYNALARDALVSGNTVTAENYFQHAEHYQRILAAAQAYNQQQQQQQQAERAERANGAADEGEANQEAQGGEGEGRQRNEGRGRRGRRPDHRNTNADGGEQQAGPEEQSSAEPAEQPAAEANGTGDQPEIAAEPVAANDDTSAPKKRAKKKAAAAVEEEAPAAEGEGEGETLAASA